MGTSALVRRNFRLLLIMAFVTIGASALLIFSLLKDTKRSPACEHRDVTDSGICKITKSYYHPTDEEFGAYLQTIQDVVNAYSNGQTEVMFESVRQLPPKAYQLKEEYRLKLERLISKIWRTDWVLNKGVKDFASSEDFYHHMKKSLAVAKLYGEFIVSSGDMVNEILVTIDWITLKRLQTYRDEFELGEKTDCSRTVEHLLADWIEQIESENGFTRVYMRAQEVGLGYFVKKGELSEEKLVQYVRDYVRPLQEHCGYTPKWLDEEFPLHKHGGENEKSNE